MLCSSGYSSCMTSFLPLAGGGRAATFWGLMWRTVNVWIQHLVHQEVQSRHCGPWPTPWCDPRACAFRRDGGGWKCLTKQVHEARDVLLCVKDEVILHMCVWTLFWCLIRLLSLHKLLVVDEMALSENGKNWFELIVQLWPRSTQMWHWFVQLLL